MNKGKEVDSLKQIRSVHQYDRYREAFDEVGCGAEMMALIKVAHEFEELRQRICNLMGDLEDVEFDKLLYRLKEKGNEIKSGLKYTK